MMIGNEYGAFIAPELKAAATGSGLLDGLYFAVKDVFAVSGHTSSAGNPGWLRSHGPAAEPAAAVKRLLQAGASLCGATHTDELMYSLGGENVHYGTPVNPRARGRIPGGSSSGSAVAVAAGSVDFALGTDTGGSVRVPAAYCGIYGFRPSHGAVEMEGVIPLAPSFDTVGWMANGTEQLLQAGRVLLERREPAAEPRAGLAAVPVEAAAPKHHAAAGTPSCPAGEAGSATQGSIARLYVPLECWRLAAPEAAAALGAGLNRLQAGAGSCAETEIAPEGLRAWMDAFRELQGAEIWATHGAWITRERPVFGPDIGARFTWAASLAGLDHSGAQTLRRQAAARLLELLGEDGCLAIPTVPGSAPERGGDLQQLEHNRNGAMMLSCIAGLAGLPQITLPVLGQDGYPLGLSVIAGPGRDLALLSWINRIWA